MNDNLKRVGLILGRSILTKLSLPIIIIAMFLLLLIVVIVASVLSEDFGESGSLQGGNKQLSEKVLKWEDDITDAVIKYELDLEYVPILLAILQQESGGDMINTNGDIFQSSESKCGSIGCITNPIESIDQAVKHFKETVSRSNGNKEVAIQSYNFGNGFADWVKKNHENKWSVDIAIEFSQKMMKKVSNPSNYTCIRAEAKPHGACYGDILYVPSIVSYLPKGNNNQVETEGVDFSGDLIHPIIPPTVTSNFGKRVSPQGIGSTDHKGIDLGCIGGVTPIRSAGAGQIVYSNYSNGYGNTVIIKHEEGFFTLYAHMSRLLKNTNDFVNAGTQIGVCGSTGNSTGPHLHFETKTSEWSGQSDPRNFINFPPSIY